MRNDGPDGKNEQNDLCTAHTLTIEADQSGKTSYCGCTISGGCLRILFNEKYLGSNMRDSTAELGKAINEAGIASSGSGGAALNFDAKTAIKKDYEPAIGAIEARIAAAIDAPVITLYHNFEANFARLAAYVASGQKDSMFPGEWQKNIGKDIISYFNAFAEKLEDTGFNKDEMLQDGFKEALERNEISLRIVDKLVKGSYNKHIIEGAVCYMQTTPKYWTTNIRDTVAVIMKLL